MPIAKAKMGSAALVFAVWLAYMYSMSCLFNSILSDSMRAGETQTGSVWCGGGGTRHTWRVGRWASCCFLSSFLFLHFSCVVSAE